MSRGITGGAKHSDTDDQDIYAKGMVHSTDEQHDLTPELNLFQFSLFNRYLGRKILEVGAGSGRLTDLVLSKVDHDEFVILEPSDHFFRMLQNHFARNASVRVIQSTTSDVVEEYRGHFDTVFSVHVMEHVADDHAFVRECLEMVQPDGRVVILVPALQFLYSDLDRNIGHYRRYDKKLIRSLIADLDVRVEKLQYNNFLGVLASAWFIRIRKLDYQKSESSRSRFFRLYRMYSKFVIPIVSSLERVVSPPLGLNLTVVLRKNGT
jgi:SAM-dependent methyltransferase